MSERIIIVGVVHGQQSCIEEVKRTIEQEAPEIVAIELPPNFVNVSTARDIEDQMHRVSTNYHNVFSFLKSMGLQLDQLEDVAVGLSLQGFEFLEAIQVARDIGARVEFIDMTRDKLFWEYLRETFENGLNRQQGDARGIEILPGIRLPAIKFPGLTAIASSFVQVLGEWRSTLDTLTAIYGEKDYRALSKVIQPLLSQVDENPAFKDILVEYRNRYMVDHLVNLLDQTDGKIVLVTGFGHVDGIRALLDERLEA
jgi:pheromone shutdown protein TraB